MDILTIGASIGVAIAIIAAASGLRVVQQTERGLIQMFGKYNRYAEPGLHWIIPFVETMIKVDITEGMVEIDTQEIITEDNLNAKVDLVIYFKVQEDEKSVKNSVYKVTNWEPQVQRLAQTTARNVIGTMPFKKVNSERNKLNSELVKILRNETASWGVQILRVELKDISPPQDVQNTMNQVIQAENTKRAAIDFATAKETEADGMKRSEIKKAEGVAQAKRIIAEGQAQSIKLVNEAAEKYFKGNAQILKKLEVTEASLKDNTKVVLTDKGISPQIILGEIPFKSR